MPVPGRPTSKVALARALAAVEASPLASTTLDLLDEAWTAARAHVVGLTGPPGVGKSTLIGRLVRQWRSMGRRVGIVAVDPSSQRSGGALLGDRTRFDLDPEDEGVFVRSMAARDRLGGIADLSAAAVTLLQAVYDVVLVETVGVGQSETDIAHLAATVVLAVQPASGDTLQFLKSGILEIPHIVVVTKADLGAPAERARRDLEAILAPRPSMNGGWAVRILAVSATEDKGTAALVEAVDAHARTLAGDRAQRRARERCWLLGAVRDEFGRRGLRRAAAECVDLLDAADRSPFRRLAAIAEALRS